MKEEKPMTKQGKEMDMLQGKLSGKLILFALPLAFSSILQQLFNSADVAVVGRFAGGNALAAVGSCVALVGIFVNLIVGLSVGPNAALASLIGQKKRDKIPEMLHTILAFGVLLGVGLMVLGLLLARSNPGSVRHSGVRYGRSTGVHTDLSAQYSFHVSLQFRSGHIAKLRRYETAYVLSDRIRYRECNIESGICHRLRHGRIRCGDCYLDFQYYQHHHGFVSSGKKTG